MFIITDDKFYAEHRNFFQIKHSRIFSQQTQNYEVELLKATRGSGVDLVINCLSDINDVQSSLNCLDSFGYCIQVGDIDAYEIQSLGKMIRLLQVPA